MNETDEIAKMLSEQFERLLIGSEGAHLESPETAQGLVATMADMGLWMACVAEEDGGAGLEPAQVAPLLSLLGYHAAPAGIGESVLAGWLSSRSGLSPSEAPVLIGTGTLVLENSLVSGTLRATAVPNAETVLARVGSSNDVVLLDLADAERTQATSGIAREAELHLTFTRTRPREMRPAPPVGPEATLAALRSAQIAGALTRALDLCVDYVNTREQFGRPIGKFQAIQHLVADLACETAAAQVAANLALGGLSGPHPSDAIAAGKIRSSKAAGKGAMLAHQLHGAIGVTREYVLHHLTRRLWQWRDDAGSEHYWADQLGAEVLSRGNAWQQVLEISSQGKPA